MGALDLVTRRGAWVGVWGGSRGGPGGVPGGVGGPGGAKMPNFRRGQNLQNREFPRPFGSGTPPNLS